MVAPKPCDLMIASRLILEILIDLGSLNPGSFRVTREYQCKLNRLYDEQKELIRQQENFGYTLPGALEAVVCILMEHVVSGNKLFGTNPLTYTRCSETVEEEYPVLFGGFGSGGGLYVISLYTCFDDVRCGVGALRKF